jgi:hypothetical protein
MLHLVGPLRHFWALIEPFPVHLQLANWLAETAARRLKIEAGLAGVAAWEAEAGALTDDERGR